jgi:hypothetical protein
MGGTMTETSQAAERDLLEIIFGPATDGQTYLNLLYLLLGFPLGIAYFVFLMAGLSIGVSLLIIFIGIPILIGVLEITRGLGAMERLLARGLLDVRIPAPPARPSTPGLLGKLKSLFSDAVTWKSLAYLGLKFPFGIATFAVLVSSFAVSIALILAPWLYQTMSMDVCLWRIETKDEAAVACMIGVILLMLCFQLVNGLAFLWGRFAQMMLGPDSSASR